MLDKDSTRQLVYVVLIDGIEPIPGYDRVETAIVGGWHVIVQKDQIAQCANKDEVYRAINNFIEQANARKPKGSNPFKSYYMRSWEQDGKTWYDVGSHVEFFYTTEK